MSVSGTSISANGEGEHGVRVRVPNSSGANKHWFPAVDRAREHYDGVISDAIDIEIPGLVRVELIEHGEVIEHNKLDLTGIP